MQAPNADTKKTSPGASRRSTMPDRGQLPSEAVDRDGFLRCPNCGARLLVTIRLAVRPVLRDGPEGLGLFARNFASRRRIEREPLSPTASCRCGRCGWAGTLEDHPCAGAFAADHDHVTE